MSSDWDEEINGIDVRRTGEDASIYRITVEAERTRRAYNSYSRVRLDYEYSVRDEDGRASLTHVGRADSNHRDGVNTHHFTALLTTVERALSGVPGVAWVETFADTVERCQPDEVGEQDDEPDADTEIGEVAA